jgi:streptogramin lyase
MDRILLKNYKLIITRVVVAIAGLIMTAPAVSSANPKSLRGAVQTGGTSSSQPLANVHVTLFEATPGLPTAVGDATTDALGRFTIPYRKSKSSSIFFLNADVSHGVEFVTILGSNLPQSATINELTTVAASYSTAQFYRTGVISGSSFGLQIAAGMNDNIVQSATGQSSAVLLNSPNADQTNSLRSTRSLANLLTACVNDPAVTATLIDLTTAAGSLPPHNTAEALANLARDPGQNVDGIFALTLLSNVYAPPLVSSPDAWTLTVKLNDSGDDSMLIGGPGNLVFDERGYAWVTNNTIQGTPNSSRFNLVFKPNGWPADGRNGMPRSPLLGGGILGAGYGVTIDPHGQVWFGNFGWGPCDDCDPSPDGNGSISRFTLTGIPVSPPDAYQGGPVRAQGMASDVRGNIWISSFGNNSVYVFEHGNPHQSVGFDQHFGGGPFDIALAADGSAWVSNGLGEPPASVARYALVNGSLEQQFRHFLGQQLRGISLDSHGNAWVASQGDNFLYALRAFDGAEIGHFNGGGVDGPWGVAVDGEDNVWVANFGPLESGPPFTGRLSKLAGVNAPPGKNVGDPISPPTGYTVPTAGSEVLLHNGAPLYGQGEPPSFIPMMRQTSVVIDQAGNIWSLNNWKPDFDIDASLNPGGDGIIIFVGLAPPPTTHVHQSPASTR